MIIQPSFGGCLHHRIAIDKLPKYGLICQHGVGSPTPWHRWHAQLPPKCGCRNAENHRQADHRRGASALFPISPILSCSYIQNKPMQNLSLQGVIRISSCRPEKRGNPGPRPGLWLLPGMHRNAVPLKHMASLAIPYLNRHCSNWSSIALNRRIGWW